MYFPAVRWLSSMPLGMWIDRKDRMSTRGAVRKGTYSPKQRADDSYRDKRAYVPTRPRRKRYGTII